MPVKMIVPVRTKLSLGPLVEADADSWLADGNAAPLQGDDDVHVGGRHRLANQLQQDFPPFFQLLRSHLEKFLVGVERR